MDPVATFLDEVAAWAGEQADVHAVALVGSHASGTARADSDVDLVVVVDDVDHRLATPGWVHRFGEPLTVDHEDWGLVQSLRVHYHDGIEAEFGLATTAWTSPPLDDGTTGVIRDGLLVVFDPDGLLAQAVAATTGLPMPVARRSAKVILVDTDDRVLLLRGRDPQASGSGPFWFLPGGGVHPGETVQQAARREVFEEVGLDLAGRDLGPIVLERRASFVFEGMTYQQDEVYFLVRVGSIEVDTSGWTAQEQRMIATHRWWNQHELMATNETVYPPGLGALLRETL